MRTLDLNRGALAITSAQTWGFRPRLLSVAPLGLVGCYVASVIQGLKPLAIRERPSGAGG
jgi:hypothetical protein